MNIYQVFSVHNTLISAHDNAATAIKHALIYQHATGQPAHVEQVPAAPRYEIQTQFIYGWENVWECEGQLEYFDSYDAAQAALDDFFEELKQDNLENEYCRSDYRIVQVSL